jgi:hypothetical protein
MEGLQVVYDAAAAAHNAALSTSVSSGG